MPEHFDLEARDIIYKAADGQGVRTILSIEQLKIPQGSHVALQGSSGAGKTTLSVGADGNAYPCHMLQAPGYCMGNLLHNSLDAILASPVRRELESATVENIDGCSLCDYRYLCGGGCRARAAIVDGPHTKDPYCTLLKTHYAKVENRMEEIIGG